MKNTIIVKNFMLFRFDEKHFHVKINIYGDIPKIQFFNMVFRLWKTISAHKEEAYYVY